MHATIRYNTLRLAMVIIVGAACYLLGARGLVLVILALVVSMPLSYFMLARWRLAMIEEIASKDVGKLNPVRAVNQRIDAANQAEDGLLDEAEAVRAERRDGEAEPDRRGEDPAAP